MADFTEREYYNKRKGAMIKERSSFISHYREITENIKPRKGRYFISDRNKGDKRHQSIINSAATRAHRIATSGMLAGTMSPTRPWFALEPWDIERLEASGVREYLYAVEGVLRNIFMESNLYGMAPELLGELLLFATGAMMHVDDYDDVARFYSQTAGSYCIALNDRLEVDTFFREFEWSVGQIVNKFKYENCSKHVQKQADNGNYDSWAPVCHFIEENSDYKVGSPWSEDKRFSSVYFEPGEDSTTTMKFLEKKGFEEFPLYAPRWSITGSDIYGTDCPGMTALGDIKGLQIEERRKAQGIDKMVSPVLTGPPSVRNAAVSQLPGGLTVYDGGDGRQKLEPLYQVNLPIRELMEDIQEIKKRIDDAFFVNLFMAISDMEGIQPRNELDIISRNEERLLQLGPVLERLHGDFLDKLVNRSFNQAVRAGILPEAPPELQGQPLRIRYISSLAMAQRAVSTQTIDRYAQFAAGLRSQGWEEVKFKFNALSAMDEYARAIGVPPSIVPADAVAEKAMQQEQQAMQAQQQLEMLNQGADTAKNLAGTGTEGKNALTDMIGNNG